MPILDFLITPICISILANVWISLLCKQGKIFESLPFFFNQFVTNNKKVNYVMFECAACLSGQLSLLYVIFDLIKFNSTLEYPLWTIVFSIFLGAFFTKLIIHE